LKNEKKKAIIYDLEPTVSMYKQSVLIVLGTLLILVSCTPFIHNDQFFKMYRTYSEIESFLKYIGNSKTKLRVGKLTLSYAVGKHKISGLVISSKNVPLKQIHNQRGVLITAGVHPREWVTTAGTLYAISRLLEKYDSPGNEILTAAFGAVTLYVVPLVNPDGYDYTWSTTLSGKTYQKPNTNTAKAILASYRLGIATGTQNPFRSHRMHRGNKNEGRDSNRHNQVYKQVDLNRNWGNPGINFGLGVRQPSSKNYQGPSAFSERETKTVEMFASKKNINFYLDIHCCSPGHRTVMAPFSLEPVDTNVAMKEYIAGNWLAKLMMPFKSARRHMYLRPETPPKKCCSSGISSGWGYNELGVTNSYTVELQAAPFEHRSSDLPRIGGEVFRAIVGSVIHAASSTDLMRPQQVYLANLQHPATKAWISYMRQLQFLPAKRVSTDSVLEATLIWRRSMNITASNVPSAFKEFITDGQLPYLRRREIRLAMKNGFVPYERTLPPPVENISLFAYASDYLLGLGFSAIQIEKVLMTYEEYDITFDTVEDTSGSDEFNYDDDENSDDNENAEPETEVNLEDVLSPNDISEYNKLLEEESAVEPILADDDFQLVPNPKLVSDQPVNSAISDYEFSFMLLLLSLGAVTGTVFMYRLRPQNVPSLPRKRRKRASAS